MKLLTFCLSLVAGSAFAATPAFTDFNTNQFATTGSAHKVTISDGAAITNMASGGKISGGGISLGRTDLGVITGGSTVNPNVVTNLYFLTTSGSTWNLNLPIIPSASTNNSPFLSLIVSNSSGVSSVCTLQFNSVATNMYRTDMGGPVNTITNDAATIAEYYFDSANGAWLTAKAINDSWSRSGGGGSGLSGTNLIVPGTVFANNNVITNGTTRPAQAVVPAVPASGFTEYADSSGRLAWIRASDGFQRTIGGTLTSNRSYTLPDASGTIDLLGRIQVRLNPLIRVDGVGCTIINTNDTTTNTFMVPRFSGSAATNANFTRYAMRVPKYFNTTVTPTASLTVRLTAADTAAASYNVGFADVANSAPSIATVGTWINIPISADATGGYDDVESTADIPLTGWNTGLTPGHWWVVQINRDGAGDASTNAQDLLELDIDYGLAQSSPIVWAPTSPTNTLVEWLDASVQSYADTDPVPTFVATVGKNATGAGAQRPTFRTNQQNGKPALVFNGTANVLQTAAFSVEQVHPYTIFAVFRSKATGAGGAFMDGIDVAKRVNLGRVGNQFTCFAGTSNQSLGATNANYNIIMVEFNDASTKFRINAGAEATVAGTPGNQNLSGVTLAARYDATLFNGSDWAELFIYSSTLSTADKIQAFNYLNSKWAIY